MNPKLNAIDDDALVQLGHALRDITYRFITVTPATHARVAGRHGNECASTLEEIFGWSRPFKPEVLPPHIWELMQRAGVLEQQGDSFKCRVRLSSLHGELFFHSAFPTTEADSVFFGPDTYRFANAIEHAIARRSRPIQRAVDVCCGAGPGGVLIARQYVDAEVLGVDINDVALKLARVNARMANTPNFRPVHSNLLRDVKGEFDLIVANPPYLIDPGERAYRHGGGPLGAGLSIAIVDAALQRVASGGALLLYTGVAMIDNRDPFLEAVEERLKAAPVEYSYCEVDPDVFGEELESNIYSRCDRIAAVVLTVTRTQ